MAEAAACRPTELAQADPPSEPSLPHQPRPCRPHRALSPHWPEAGREAELQGQRGALLGHGSDGRALGSAPLLQARLRREGPRLKPKADQSGRTRAAAAET